MARQNARRNRVNIDFSHRDLLASSQGRKFDVVCANLTSDLLLAAKAQILDTLNSPGVLITAGMLDSQFAPIREACEKSGLRFIRSKTEKGWTSGVFFHPGE